MRKAPKVGKVPQQHPASADPPDPEQAPVAEACPTDADYDRAPVPDDGDPDPRDLGPSAVAVFDGMIEGADDRPSDDVEVAV